MNITSLGKQMVIGFGLLACSVAPASGTTSDAQDGWDYTLSAAELTTLCETTLARARLHFTAIEGDTAVATVATVFTPYDAMLIDLQAIQHVEYMKAVHPDPLVQTAAEHCTARLTDFITAINLSPRFYQRVAAIDTAHASDAEGYMIDKRLRLFRQAGVDRDRESREKVRDLMADITRLGNSFEREIRTDKRYVKTTIAELDGLPQDFLDRHPADENGVVIVSTAYPDYLPILRYATNDALRYRLYSAAKNIATPGNSATLHALLTKRHELATLLGYESYAAMAMDGLMVSDPETAQRFLDRVGSAVQQASDRDMARLLARLQRIDPQAEQVQAWQIDWLKNLVQQEEFALDTREIRTYFQFERVQAGIFLLCEKMFGIQIVPWRTATWHADVTAWEIRERGKPIGRFYLDMHPRNNKYGHAAHWTLRRGLESGQLPLSGMATNFPRGLMEHKQVESFLHEFGHLLHNMFSGTQPWLDISGMTMERDFVEAPSQLLEQWAWHYDTLREFAIDENGKPISPALVAKMNASRQFGEAANTSTQIFYANLALNYHHRDPSSFQLLPLLEELQAQHSPIPYVEDTHFYNNFRHLNGYSSNYYTYQWSQAIAMDLFSRFQTKGLSDSGTARRLREMIFAPAGSKPAAAMVADFLGRPFSATTYALYLNHLN